jgi:hypothetical protein
VVALRILNSEALTVYKIDYSDVDGKTEVQFKYLTIMVGERGFEPPTPWSRNAKLKIPNASFGVAYGLISRFFLSLSCTEVVPICNISTAYQPAIQIIRDFLAKWAPKFMASPSAAEQVSWDEFS